MPVKILSLKAGDFEHIQFRSKNPSVYQYRDNELVVDVDNSASFLMQAFTEVKLVTDVSFEWRSEGLPAIKDAEHESSREGDDAVFKLGLLVEAPNSVDDIFLVSWMRRVHQLLNFHSEEIIFMVAGAKHDAEQHWTGPYNRRITMIAMNAVADGSGWTKASYQFSEPIKVVAVWLMADGDDTSSDFKVRVKNIGIE